MVAVAITVAALLALLVALLAVPLVLAVDAERTDTLNATWRVRWLFGLVEVHSSPGRRAPTASERSEAARSPRRPEKVGGKRLQTGLAVLRTRGLLRRVVRLVVTLLSQVKLTRLRVQAAVGFDDPADTGFFYGMLSPLLVMADVRGLDVHCRPMFLEAGVQGVVRATVHVRPIAVVSTMAAFLVSPPVLRAVLAVWRARR